MPGSLEPSFLLPSHTAASLGYRKLSMWIIRQVLVLITMVRGIYNIQTPQRDKQPCEKICRKASRTKMCYTWVAMEMRLLYHNSTSYYSTQRPSGYKKFDFSVYSAQAVLHAHSYFEVQLNKMYCNILCGSLICLNIEFKILQRSRNVIQIRGI